MPIDVEWQDEFGRPLARYDGPLVGGGLSEAARPTSACLRFIDPYGNTVFNQWQLEVLRGELAEVAADVASSQRLVAMALLKFIDQARDHVQTYVKFIGD
jgi:hypothetical protein